METERWFIKTLDLVRYTKIFNLAFFHRKQNEFRIKIINYIMFDKIKSYILNLCLICIKKYWILKLKKQMQNFLFLKIEYFQNQIHFTSLVFLGFF